MARSGSIAEGAEFTMSSGDAQFLPQSLREHGEAVRRGVLEWFRFYGREFPWRVPTREFPPGVDSLPDPYPILVSEVMLQQTQTGRVALKLPEFLRRFPTVRDLAAASTGDLLRAWQGMGYNRRALRLQETARTVVDRHGGAFPSTVEELNALPGVGGYTAAAIACFAFGRDVPVIDVNIVRVLSRLFYKCHTSEQALPESTVRRVAVRALPAGDAYRWHQALMDLGATICTARNPRCGVCPVADFCLSAFPLPLRLYGIADGRKEEPSLRGVPRRLWRGRLVELLRSEHAAVALGALIDRLLADPLHEPTEAERRQLLRMAEMLLEEGLIVRKGLREGALEEHDRVALPE